MTKKQINNAARMIAYHLIKSADIFAFDGANISEEDKEKLHAELHQIADNINGLRATNIGSTKAIIEYVIAHTPKNEQKIPKWLRELSTTTKQ